MSEISVEKTPRGSLVVVRYGAKSERIHPDSDKDVEKLANRWGIAASAILGVLRREPEQQAVDRQSDGAEGANSISSWTPGPHAWHGATEICGVELWNPISPHTTTGAAIVSGPCLVFESLTITTTESPIKFSALERALLFLGTAPRGFRRFITQITLSDPFTPGDCASPHEVVCNTRDDGAIVTAAEMGFKVGERLPHERCPFDPGPSSRDPVVVLSDILYCHKCQRGISYSQLCQRSHGLPWMLQAARNWVHYGHTKFLLADADMPKYLGRIDLRKKFWSAYVRAFHTYGASGQDSRVSSVTDDALPFLRDSRNLWVHNETFEPVDLDKTALSAFPTFRRHPTRIAVGATQTPLPGFKTIRLCTVDLRQDGEPVIETRPELSPQPYMSAEEAWATLEKQYPGLSRFNARTLLTAWVCAQTGPAKRPIILTAIGPTGSGKSQTPEIVAAITGGRTVNVSHEITNSEDAMARAVGSSVASPNVAALVLDEIDKISTSKALIRSVLLLRNTITYRPLYSSAQTTIELRVPIVMTCISQQTYFASPEFARRVQLLRYKRRVVWDRDPQDWVAENPRVAASLIYHAKIDASRHNYVWDSWAVAAGLTRSDDGMALVDSALLDALTVALGDDSNKLQSGKYVGWSDVTTVVQDLLPDTANAHAILTRDLNALDWGDRKYEFKQYRGRIIVREGEE